MPTRAPSSAAARAAANATAALGSISCFVRSHTTRIASTIAGLVDDDLLDAVLVEDRLGARRAARAQAVGDGRRRGRAATPPITRSGATAIAVPEHSPPPPIGVTTTSRSGISSRQLERGGSRARDHALVVERMDLDRARALDDLGQRARGARRGCCRTA